MAQQDLENFKNTSPQSGQARFIYNSSNLITGMTISIYDCSGASRIEAISNLSSFTLGSDTVITVNGEPKVGYYYYDVSPNVPTGSLDTEEVCSTTNLTPPPKIYNFRNSEYNATYNNALEIRRIERSGSLSDTEGGVYELVKKSDQIIPQNLESVMNGSATTASFQESNIYSKSWTLPRYDGSKLDSGSLFFNDPALSFIGFEAVKFPLIESSSFIRSQSYADLNVEQFYFNPPYNYAKGLYDQGSTNPYPSPAQPVYEKIGKEYKRITKSKIFIPGTDDVIQLSDYQAYYEVRPVDDTSVPVVSGDNIFQVMIETSKNIEYYSYYNSGGVRQDNIELRPMTSDVIFVSGSYVGEPINAYALDVPSSYRGNNHPIFSLTGPSLSNRTFIEIISSSNNIP